MKRIQRKRTRGWKMPLNTVYVGRGSKWGNRFTVKAMQQLGYPNAAEMAVRFFEADLRIGLDYSELRGKNLACWCPLDQPCHADVLLRLAK